MPLGTYLPDGDIDLSIYSFAPNAHESKELLKETWATQLQMVLEDEIGNPRTNFKVADVQVIHAEVRFKASGREHGTYTQTHAIAAMGRSEAAACAM